ncbi:MAG: HD domain-containing protein [Nitrososphaeraceae archaeon]
MNNLSTYQKKLIALRSYLHGARYFKALKALDYGIKIHTGFRKDNITPEFQHQVEIALYITTLRGLQHEEAVLAAALLHDAYEDYPATQRLEIEAALGKEITIPIVTLSKNIQGMRTYENMQSYFDKITNCEISSIVKGCDRIHNLHTMVGVFSPEKQKEYIEETKQFFLPMIKKSLGLHPLQYLAYMNIRTVLKTQIQLLEACISAA